LINTIENKEPLPISIRNQYAGYGRMGIYGGKTKPLLNQHISVYISSSSIAIEDKKNQKTILQF
jgi:hypothetical protein